MFDVNTKKVINGSGDLNQLMPFKYPWAWKYFLNANKNHWTPVDINMAQDVVDYHTKLTAAEKHVFENTLAYLSTADIMAMRNIGLAVMEKMTAPELQIYQGRQVYEECLAQGHEVLTPSGWVDLQELEAGIPVATYNLNSRAVDFEVPSRIVKYCYSGLMKRFESRNMDQFVTGGHRMPYISRETKEYKVKTAAEFSDGLCTQEGFVVSPEYKHPGGSLTAEEQFLIATQADDVVTVSSEETHNLPVACVTVSTGFFLTRRNGKVSVTGNCLHSWSYSHAIETIGLDQSEIYNRYRTVPEIFAKIQYSTRKLDPILRHDFDLSTDENIRTFLLSYLFFAGVFEGVWFYNGFTPLYSLQRRGLMKGTGEQLQYIQRDECLTPDHEVLTPEGWKSISEVEVTDLVLQASPDGNHSFVYPSRVVHNDHDGLVYHFHNKQGHFNQQVTPGHRMVTLSKGGFLRTGEARSVSAHPYMKFVCNFEAVGEGVGSLTPLERLAVAYQADGEVPRNQCDGSITGHVLASWSFKRDRKILRFREVAQATGLNWVEKPEKDGYTRFCVEVPLAHAWLIDKDFGWVDLLTAEYAWCRGFVEEIAEWDGSRAAANRVRYDNANERAADVVQAVATVAGYRTLRKVIKDERKESYSGMHRVYVVKDYPLVQGGAVEKTEAHYVGKVHCLTVPTGMFFVRRGASVSVTGNCSHAGFGLRVVRQIIEETGISPHKDDVLGMWTQCRVLEHDYACFLMPSGFFGYDPSAHVTQFEYLANRRMAQVGANYEPFPGAECAVPWLDEQANIRKEKNFFETRVTEYQTGGMSREFKTASLDEVEQDWESAKRK